MPTMYHSSILLDSALTVVCGLGKLRLISSLYPEQFEFGLSSFDRVKMSHNPEPTKYR